MNAAAQKSNIRGLSLLLVIVALLVTHAAAPARGQRRRPLPTSSQRKAVAQPESRYLLFWRAPERAADLAKTIGERGDGRTRLLGFGVPCSTFVEEGRVAANIHHAFATARRCNLAVMLQFDFHVDWSNRPDLWNWFDPHGPGYNPGNRRNVEWFGWDGPPARARYLNWGEVRRMAPPMCFTSAAVRSEWTRLIHDVIGPPLRREVAALGHEGRGRLFAGVLVGSEPTFDNYSVTDSDTAKAIAADGAPAGQLGYRALLDRGYSAQRPPPDIHLALSGIVQETVAFWCKAFVTAGIPAGKLYPHIPAGARLEATSALPDAAFNAWSRPGWSTYPAGSLEQNLQPLYTALKQHGNPPWAGMEANAGVPGSLVDWETYLAWHYNHGAVLLAVNTGATGTELPARLEQSAFGPQALAAYRRLLRGQALRERPVAADQRLVRIRRKMDTLQLGFRRWQDAGRDPAPIGRMVEQRLPALLQANRLEEAESLIDEAIKQVNEKER